MYSAVNPTGMLDQMIDMYKQTATTWFHSVFLVSHDVFYYLAVFQLTIAATFWALKKADLMAGTAAFVGQLLKLSFFWMLVLSANTWIPAIINSFRIVGEKAGVMTGLDPSSVFNQALYLIDILFSTAGGWGLLTSPVALLVAIGTAIGILILYAFICAELVITIIFIYYFVAACTLFFALGASALTNPIAKNAIKMTIGLGIKLMLLYVLISIGYQVGTVWGMMTKGGHINDYAMVIFGVIVYFLIMKTIPNRMAEVAGCGNLSIIGGTEVAAAMQTAAVATTLAASRIAKVGAMMGQMGNLGVASYANSRSKGGNIMGSVTKGFGSAAGGLASGMMKSFGAHAMGDHRNKQSLAKHMQSKAKAIRSKNK